MSLPLCLLNFCVIYFLITFYKLLTRYCRNCHTEAAFNLILFIAKTQTVTWPVRRQCTPERCRQLKCRWRGYCSILYRWYSDQQWYFDTFFLQPALWFRPARATSRWFDDLNLRRMKICTRICLLSCSDRIIVVQTATCEQGQLRFDKLSFRFRNIWLLPTTTSCLWHFCERRRTVLYIVSKLFYIISLHISCSHFYALAIKLDCDFMALSERSAINYMPKQSYKFATRLFTA